MNRCDKRLCLCGHSRTKHNYNHITGRGTCNHGSECELCTCTQFDMDNTICVSNNNYRQEDNKSWSAYNW